MPDTRGRGRRRNFLIKQWFQLRNMIFLAAGTLLGGAVYAVVLRYFLRKRLLELMYQSHSVLVNTWQALYPMIFRWTMVLFLGCLVLLLAFLQIFAARVGRAAGEVEKLCGDLGENLDKTVDPGRISVKEFGQVGAGTVDMVRFYQDRWKTISREAEAIADLFGRVPEGGEGLSPDAVRRLDALMDRLSGGKARHDG